MNWFIKISILATFSFSVLGNRKSRLASIREYYANQETMRDEYLELLHDYIEKGKFDPCLKFASDITQLQKIDMENVDVKSGVIFGDFNGTEGYNLILDDYATINIPAVVECIPKYKDGTDIKIGSKIFSYYFIYYGHKNTTPFESVFRYDKIMNDKSTFILEDAITIQEYLHTYTGNRTHRKNTIKWFKNEIEKNTGKEICESIAPSGQMEEKTPDKWKIITGNINIGKNYILLLTENLQIDLPYIIECTVQVTKKYNNKSKKSTEKKYFTLSKIGAEWNPDRFHYVYGPVVVNTKTVFALYEKFLQKYIENNKIV